MSASTSDWEPPLPEELQRMLPQYEITGIIGRGGMGAVYQGRQAKLNRKVAIKLLPETFTQGDDELNFAKRFEQEAQAMAGLDHPAIISVYDFGETPNGQLYFVMEFIDGMDIHEYLKHHGGRLPQEHALSITAHVLDALEYAHQHGIVHRDIKPANILLNREGRVKIADFGLAKKFGEHADESAPALTMSNVAVGTPDFVAPEALDPGAKPDHRADLYAVGVMLYQMLTGKLPRGNFRLPSEMQPEIDPRLDVIVGKAMEADPDHRYASASAVRADLDRILSQPMQRIEPGAESDAVPAAVPVTLSVKGGGQAPGVARRGSPAGTKPARPGAKADPAPAKGGNTGLIVGLSVAAAVVLGLGLFWLFGTGRGNQTAEGKGKDSAPATAGTPGPEMPKTAPAPTANPASPTPVAATTPPPVTNPGTPKAPATETKAPVPTKAPETPPVTVAKSEPPAPAPVPASQNPSPSPMPTPNPAPAVPATPPTPTPAPTSDPAIARLAALPGLKTRLDGYLAARTKQIGELAVKYRGGLQTRLDQAANAGDLKLATAFQAETARVEALQKAIATLPADPLSAATDATITALPALPEGSPEPLVALRQTWTTESDKIQTTLDAALRQSLQALEAELTKAREFENAQAVVAYREAIGNGATGAPSGIGFQPMDSKGNTPPTEAIGRMPMPQGRPDLTLALATKEKPYENSLGMKFVPVPDTDVLFCIHEVRWKDYIAYATDVPGVNKDWQSQTHEGFKITERPEDHPVVMVSWDDAQAFCAWLSKKEGKTFRLPTDREWSVAVGIGRDEKWKDDTTPATVFKPQDTFPWGDRWPPPKGAGNYSDESRRAKAPGNNQPYIEGYDDGFPTTAPVMSFKPNKLGIFDLGGNVFEWCEDWYDNTKTVRVLRDGPWISSGRNILLSSYRYHNTPTHRSNSYGFRVVVELAAPATNPTPAPVAPAPPSATRPSSLPDPALARATKDAPFANSLGMKFVPVPDTDVLFCIHETRYRDYAAYAAEMPGVEVTWKDQFADGFKPTDRSEDHPVIKVNWDDAQKFCAWLSKKEGKTYRLPTDREWSVAVGIGREEDWKKDTTPAMVKMSADAFPWMGDFPPRSRDKAGNFSDESRHTKAPGKDKPWLRDYDDGFPTTAPVMSFKPNEFGLFDLGGNISEWCEDWYDNLKQTRVLRGSSWDSGTLNSLLSSYRDHLPPGIRYSGRGFRVVIEPAAPATNPTPAPAAPAPPSAIRPSAPDPALAHATKDAPFENSLGMKFVPMPDTDVLFCIHETRYRDYAAYAAKMPVIDVMWKDRRADGFTLTDRSEDHPVINVNWDDAQKFCAWLSKKEGKTYRLPTDREWSIAVGVAREEDWKQDTTPATVFKPQNAFPWGGDYPPRSGDRAGNYSDESRHAKAPGNNAPWLKGYDDAFPTTAPVMSFEPNKQGIFDLGGNVYEWVEDWYDNARTDRVLRGGSWDSHERGHLLSSFRHRHAPGYRSLRHGFRVVIMGSAAG